MRDTLSRLIDQATQANVGHPTPVGIYPLGNTPEGVSDLGGNVWEWTRSLWGKVAGEPEFAYPYVADDGRERLDASADVWRVLRGGSFGNAADYARCAGRRGSIPDNRLRVIGFRVVASPFPSAGL